MAEPESAYFVPSVDTAARVLAMLTRYRTQSCTLSEITSALDVSKTTCLRVLKTLQAHGLVAFDANSKRYSLGYYCVVLGSRAQESLDYLAALRPLMRECARRTGHTIVFAQRVPGDRLMYVAKEDSGNPMHINVSVGNRFPVTDVSYGKWVLAFADEAERRRLLANGLRQVTPRTRTEPDEYLAEVARLPERGVLVSRGEYLPGVLAVSCPVLDSGGGLLGVLVALGLSDAVDEDELDTLRSVMREMGTRCRFDGGASGFTA
ncbi:IclR family transcriptional regulator [Amycolatopsis cynarae]|uniref:IclR family transcriptional regulator n=1 Tax=Amycolatopsis cynarae TaxID=2995223 RepID=A0ABY7B3Q3_9PSEU|nr:IclR family transcriptional regulator [Amycolatopsis sp. HUAS 11-8]WAL65863.1 IclR family transcriptional regulator [Amycolatopsis sp. HUAS 11-8]